MSCSAPPTFKKNEKQRKTSQKRRIQQMFILEKLKADITRDSKHFDDTDCI